MTALVAVVFERDERASSRELDRLRQIDPGWLVILDNAVAVALDAAGQITSPQCWDMMTREGADWIERWRSFVASMLNAQRTTEVSRSLAAATLGPEGRFIHEIRTSIRPGDSAIFALTRPEWVDRLAAQFREVDALVLRSALPDPFATTFAHYLETGHWAS